MAISVIGDPLIRNFVNKAVSGGTIRLTAFQVSGFSWNRKFC
jgi:hypothetical protein